MFIIYGWPCLPLLEHNIRNPKETNKQDHKMKWLIYEGGGGEKTNKNKMR